MRMKDEDEDRRPERFYTKKKKMERKDSKYKGIIYKESKCRSRGE